MVRRFCNLVLLLLAAAAWQVHAEPACRTSAVAVADAYILSNPLNAYILATSFEGYVANNAARFRADGDATRCARALGREAMAAAVRLFNPEDLKRREELEARLGSMGIQPGPQQATASSQMFAIGMRLNRLARGLPAATTGNFEPYNTPTSEIEQLHIFGEQMLGLLLQMPETREAIAMNEPLIRELIRLEHHMVRNAAAALGGAK